MDLKYVLSILLKILISTPSTLVFVDQVHKATGAALLGDHFVNRSNISSNATEEDVYYDYDMSDSQELDTKNSKTNSEEIPDPSPLVLPGYNLPENIFNQGKPFYVEKDPITGKIDFRHKSPSVSLDDDMYTYDDEPESDNIYDKSNIDRKDGNIGSHRPSDVNQLTPNFHDFLNLPVKYNPDKYVAPLISSSYASTKIQGSVNKFHNHKDYIFKPTSYKPTVSPTYFSTSQYFSKAHTTTKTTTTTTTRRPTTVRQYPEISITTNKPISVINSANAHPTFNEEFDDYYDEPVHAEKHPASSEVYLTTGSTKVVYHSSKAPPTSEYQTSSPFRSTNAPRTTEIPKTTTKKVMSIFEQLFGDYDETVATIETTTRAVTKPTTKYTPPSLFNNLPGKKNSNQIKGEEKIQKPPPSTTTSTTSTTTTSTTTQSPTSTTQSSTTSNLNVLTGTNMGIDPNYEYDYDNEKYEDNVAVENKPVATVSEDELKIEPLNSNKYNQAVSTTTTSTKKPNAIIENYSSDYSDYSEKDFAPITSTTIRSTVSVTTTSRPTSTTQATSTLKVTSLPLGDNHINNNKFEPFNKDPIIVATQNLREKLNSEKVMPKPFEKPIPISGNHPPSKSNIHIAHDQNTVSFVVGNQQSVGDGQYVGTALKETPYDSNPFRPLFGHQATYSNDNSVSYSIQAQPEASFQITHGASPHQIAPEVVGSAVTIQPLKNSEASLAIGMPINGVQTKPGQVVDEKLDVAKENKDEKPPSTNTPGSKIVFPNEKEPEFPDLVPPPPRQPVESVAPSHDVLGFNSKIAFPQLPSDLTPPKEQDVMVPPPRTEYNRPIRPPWDPRPGHFHSGKPEYNRPPRPNMAFKRIDNLPNILPQFRPNMKKHIGHPGQFMRQPLLERPSSNRPIGFLEKLQPPPPPAFPTPPRQNIQLRNSPTPPPPLDPIDVAQDRIINEDPRRPITPDDQYGFYQTPPQIKIANRRHSNDETEIETLQMIQAKKSEKNDKIEKGPLLPSKTMQIVNIPPEEKIKDNTEKSIYKVYPVNTPPIKLDVIDNDKKETVVIGTRAEIPLPPSKISNDFIYEPNPLFDNKDRNDAPILKPHPRPPIKTDIPYPLERPDPSLNHPAVPEIPTKNGNDLEDLPNNKFEDEREYYKGNQWNSVGESLESRIVTGQKVHAVNPNQISVTLKTYTEKPIAIAYTPTEPYLNADKYSMPNYGSPVIPEIRPSNNKEHGSGNKEFTVSAVMHTHPQKAVLGQVETVRREEPSNHRVDTDEPNYPKLDFEAPFQASVNLDTSMSQGWAVVRDKNKTNTEVSEGTTLAYATTSEFDIENFKPQLEGGFKPIYSFPDDKTAELTVNEREE